jgi:chaperonin cofactor prefoldin
MPRIKSELAREYQEQYKKLTKIEKLEQEIQNYENRILEIDYNLSSIEGITDERIGTILTKEGHWSHNNPSWEQIIKNGAADNFNNSETEYLESVKKSKKHGIEFWRTQNIEWPTRSRKGYQKELTKLQSKLNAVK